MRVLNVTEQKFGTGVDEDRAHVEVIGKKLKRYKGKLTLFDFVTLLTFQPARTLSDLRRALILFLTNQRKFFAFYYRAIDRDFGNIFAARHVIHDVEHDAFEHGTQRTRACAFGNSLRGESAQSIFGHRQTDSLHREELRVLLYHRVFCFSQNRQHFIFSERIERTNNGQAPYEFRYHPERQQIFRFNMADRLFTQRFLDLERRAAKAHHFLANPFLDDFVEANKCATANEKDLFGVDLNVFLVRMLAPALGRNITRAAFQNFQQSLLDAFAGDIARDAHVVGLAPDLVDLIYVNNADLSALHIIIGILKQSQNDVLDVFTNITGFGQRCSVSNAERHVEDSG